MHAHTIVIFLQMAPLSTFRHKTAQCIRQRLQIMNDVVAGNVRFDRLVSWLDQKDVLLALRYNGIV